MSEESPDISATSTHVEVELKFDVDDSSSTPSFDGLADIATVQRQPTQKLSAVYFDTSGRDLAAHRVTLRRRTGGSDAGWHLKLPAGSIARTEIRSDFGDGVDDDVPPALRDVVLAIVRDRPLSVVARIDNQRTIDILYGTDGTALAEFCDDRVTAAAEGNDAEQRWREWELELAEDSLGDGIADGRLLKRLSKRLRESGATPARHASKLARILGPSAPPSPGAAEDPLRGAPAQQVEKLVECDRAVRVDATDSVHQMGVAARTIRSLLQSAPDLFGLSAQDQIIEELGELTRILGAARDAEVLAERYRRALDGLPPELQRGPISQRLVDGSRQRYRAELSKALNAMRSPQYFHLLDYLEALIVAVPVGSAGSPKSHTSDTIEDSYTRVRKRAKRAATADAADHDAALHAIRKSAKRLRYTAEAMGAEKVARRAKRIQTLLGDHQDSVVSRKHLAAEADIAHLCRRRHFHLRLALRDRSQPRTRLRAGTGRGSGVPEQSRAGSALRHDPLTGIRSPFGNPTHAGRS